MLSMQLALAAAHLRRQPCAFRGGAADSPGGTFKTERRHWLRRQDERKGGVKCLLQVFYRGQQEGPGQAIFFELLLAA